MKQKVLIALLFITLLFNVCVYATSNLITNGGFESGLTGWKGTISSGSGTSVNCVYSGLKSFVLSGNKAEQHAYYLSDSIDRSKTYELSAWVKSENLSSDSGFYLGVLGVASSAATNWLYKDGVPNPKQYSLCATGGTHDWKKLSYTFNGSSFSENTNKLQVYLYLEGNVTGKVYIDDVTLKEADFAIEPVFSRFGNIFIKGEETKVLLASQNRTNEEKSICVNYKVTDDYNSPKYSGTVSYNLVANSDKEYELILPVTDCGAYSLKLDITAGDVVLKKETSFAIIMQDNSDNISLDFGTVSHCGRLSYFNAGPELYFETMALAGCGWIRDEYRWESIETTKGKLADTERIRRTAKAIKENNMKALVLLGFGNTLYDMDTIAQVPVTTAQLEGWENYVTFIVQYMKDVGYTSDDVVFEVWNEYSGGQSNSTHVSNEHYVNVIKTAYEAVKEIMPDAAVMTEGMAGVVAGKGRERFETYCKTGALNYCDIIGMHPYTNPLMPDDNNLFEGAVDEFRSIMSDYKYADRPIFHSEVGIQEKENTQYGPMHDRENAISNIRLYVLNKKMQAKYGFNDVLFIYQLAEQQYIPADKFGMMRSPWSNKGANSAKLSYVTFDSAISLLGNAQYEEYFVSGNVQIHKLKNADDSNVFVLWTNTAREDISLRFNDTPVIYDMNGNKLKASSANGEIQLTVTREPVFIIGDLENIIDTKLKLVDYSKACRNGETCYAVIEVNADYSGKEMTVAPVLPYGWKWINSDITLSADESNVLLFSVPECNNDSMNSIILNVSAEGESVARLEFTTEAVNSVYADNLITDSSMEEESWNLPNSSYQMYDNTVANSGSQSIKIIGTTDDIGDNYVESPSPDFVVGKGEKYILSAWLKTDNPNCGTVSLVIRSHGNSWTQEMILKPDTDWAQFKTVVDIGDVHIGEKFDVWLYVPKGFSGNVWLDDVELRRIRIPQGNIKENLVADNSFEENLWESINDSYSYSTDHTDGNSSLKLMRGGLVRTPEFIKIDSGNRYTVSFDVKGEGQFYIRLRCYVGENEEVMIENAVPVINHIMEQTDWRQISFTLTPDIFKANTKFVKLEIGSYSTSDIFIDNFKFVKTFESEMSALDGNVIPDSYVEANDWHLPNKNTTQFHDYDVSYSGGKSIRLSSGYVLAPTPLMKVDYTKKYILSARIKSEKSNPGIVNLIIYANDGTEVEKLSVVPVKNWVDYKTVIDFTELVRYNNFRFKLSLNNGFNGFVWLDNVTLTPIDEDTGKVSVVSVDETTIKGKLYSIASNSYTVIAAMYSGGKLIDCVTTTLDTVFGYNEFVLNMDSEIMNGNIVKLFVWDGLTPVKSNCEYIIN